MESGKLILISTPIGNLADLTPRAKTELTRLEVILAEDTRALLKLLSLVEIEVGTKKISSFHDHNREAILRVIETLKSGVDVGIVSDAGSPVLSDPAYPLVQAVIEAGLELETLPGVSSVTTALELSGLAPHPFSFTGFLPREREKKLELIERYLELGTLVCFESPHRIERTLEEIAERLPSVQVAIARELTKKFQSVHRFLAGEWDQVKSGVTIKGEFVLVLAAGGDSKRSTGASSSKLQELARSVLERPSAKSNAKLLSEILGIDTKEIYKLLTK